MHGKVGRRLRAVASLAVTIPVASLLVASTSASAATAVVTFTGSVTFPAQTSSGTVAVQVEQGYGPVDPAVLTDVTVVTQTFSSGSFTIPVPSSAPLIKAEVRGWVAFVVTAVSGNYMTQQNISVPVTAQAADCSAAVNGELSTRSVPLPAFPSFYKTRSALIAVSRRSGSCTWRRYGREQEKPIHIGEIHLLNARGLKVKWDYANEADTTATLGLSLSPNKNWADGGTHTATNSIGTDSGFTVGNRHLLRWVVGDAYFQRYSRNVLCAGYPYKNQLDHMAGDSWMGGTGKHHNIAPKPNPYHGCLKSNDPYGNAQVHPGDHFASDRAVATTVSGGATVYGFSFSDSTGYTSSIHHDYTNKSRSTVYLCGKGYMPDVPMLYNGNV